MKDKVTSIAATLHSAGQKGAENRGTINFSPLDENERHWELDLEDTKCLGFFREVWPYVTMGDLCRMDASLMKKIMWSAYGYGVTVKIMGDTRW